VNIIILGKKMTMKNKRNDRIAKEESEKTQNNE
jgi:hypothetical protein